jgi:hypothetical protein
VADLGYLFDNYPEMERYARLSMGSLFGHLIEHYLPALYLDHREIRAFLRSTPACTTFRWWSHRTSASAETLRQIGPDGNC